MKTKEDLPVQSGGVNGHVESAQPKLKKRRVDEPATEAATQESQSSTMSRPLVNIGPSLERHSDSGHDDIPITSSAVEPLQSIPSTNEVGQVCTNGIPRDRIDPEEERVSVSPQRMEKIVMHVRLPLLMIMNRPILRM